MAGEIVEVEVNKFIEGTWKCPTCYRTMKKNLGHRKGRYLARCHVCGQELIKDESTGQWKALNCIAKENKPGDIYREVEGEAANPIAVIVDEVPRIEGRKWHCPNCHHGNETRLPEFPSKDTFVDGEAIKSIIYMKCWSCGLMIEFTGDEKNWMIFKEGRFVKNKPDKPIEDNAFSDGAKKYWD